MNRPWRVLLVDDSVVIRGMLSRFVDAESDLEVVATAANGRIGVSKVVAHDPDIVVLDIEMPVMNGLEALREIRVTHPKLPIIMFSTLTGRGGSATLEALAAGATDYALKPTTTNTSANALQQVRDELIIKIRALCGATQAPIRSVSRPSSTTPAAKRESKRSAISAVIIGSSTGGPVALDRVLSDISKPLPVPTIVVQHMPSGFTKSLADRLDRRTCHCVVEAETGMEAAPGSVFIAPGGRQMRLVRRSAGVVFDVFDGPLVNSCRPSLDPTFMSAGEIYGSHALTVMLTGMGADGTEGTRVLADAGADVIAQDEATCTVWGMPRSVFEAGLTTEVLPLDGIGQRITSLVTSRAARAHSLVGAQPS